MAHFDSDHVDDDGERGDESDVRRRRLRHEDRVDTDGADDWTRPMDRALELAARGPGSGRCNPNPRVGCVIVSDDTVVGEGYHHGAGTAHAEVEALRDAGDAARGATAVVTLEPCNHTGRTGPCTEALIAAGVKRVVIAQRDPNPQARGGVQRLQDAGVEVVAGVRSDDALLLNTDYTFDMEHGRPWVVWKIASTLDGYVAAADGTSKWITSEQTRQQTHEMRTDYGAIVVGTGTVLADDPHLIGRAPGAGQEYDGPLRVVVGTRELPSELKVFDDIAPTLVMATHDPAAVLAALHDRGIHRVLLEGGPTLAAAFLAVDLVDEVDAYVAPVLLGAGKPAVGPFGAMNLAQARRFHRLRSSDVGSDVQIIATRRVEPWMTAARRVEDRDWATRTSGQDHGNTHDLGNTRRRGTGVHRNC